MERMENIMMPALLKSICDNLTAKFNYSTQQTNQQIANNNMQLMNQNIAYQQIQLQNALFQVFKGMTISPQLCRLNVPQDLSPCGTRPVNGMMVYYFEWTKINTAVIPTSMLKIYTTKMNTAINSQNTILNMIFQQPSCNVFHILGCQDNGTSIILAVTY